MPEALRVEIDRYRATAREVRRDAGAIPAGDTKRRLLEIAKRYDALAERLEKDLEP